MDPHQPGNVISQGMNLSGLELRGLGKNLYRHTDGSMDFAGDLTTVSRLVPTQAPDSSKMNLCSTIKSNEKYIVSGGKNDSALG
jgi:hypothetical protein